MKLNTQELQNLVTRVSRGASNNKLLPLTSLVEVRHVNGSLILTTTDGINYYSVEKSGVDGETFVVSVNVDTFTKLVQKMTSETISIEALDNCLMVVGNGKYKIDLLLDENGEPVEFPDTEVVEEGRTGTFSVASIRKILAQNKASLATDSSIPCLMNYYFGDKVITTDRYKICQTDEKILSKPNLLSPSVVEFLATFEEDTVNYFITDKAIHFETATDYIYAPFVDGLEKMPIEALTGLIENDIPYSCTVSKASLLATLDRLSLFVSPYDNNVVYLTFTSDGLEVTSVRSNSRELVEYTDGLTHDIATCAIDVEMLKSQVNTVDSDSVTIYYGSDVAIKIVSDGVIRVVALQEDNRK